jgi:hypothetical protein
MGMAFLIDSRTSRHSQYPNIPIPLQEISIDVKAQFGYRKNLVSASLAFQYVGLPLTAMNNLDCHLIRSQKVSSYQINDWASGQAGFNPPLI